MLRADQGEQEWQRVREDTQSWSGRGIGLEASRSGEAASRLCGQGYHPALELQKPSSE